MGFVVYRQCSGSNIFPVLSVPNLRFSMAALPFSGAARKRRRFTENDGSAPGIKSARLLPDPERQTDRDSELLVAVEESQRAESTAHDAAPAASSVVLVDSQPDEDLGLPNIPGIPADYWLSDAQHWPDCMCEFCRILYYYENSN